jgi:hypothetical protein
MLRGFKIRPPTTESDLIGRFSETTEPVANEIGKYPSHARFDPQTDQPKASGRHG